MHKCAQDLGRALFARLHGGRQLPDRFQLVDE